jgi:hypothetical protein
MDAHADPTWIKDLVADFPGLGPLYAEHVNYFGVLLPHLLFGDVVRWIVELYEAGEVETVKAFLDRLEQDYPSLDTGSRNVVEVSFVEDLPASGQAGSEIALWLGPALREEYLRAHPRTTNGE